MKVLIIEDNKWMQQQLERALKRESYSVDLASDGESGLEKARLQDYDAIILDVGLPDCDGFSVLDNLRQFFAGPVLFLTARRQLSDRVRGLDQGADDYLMKPFERDELLARLRAVMRRKSGVAHTMVEIGDVLIDLGAQRVFRVRREVRLTGREFAILRLLTLKRGKVVSSSDLLNAVLDENSDALSNLINVHIFNLRKKLGKDLIETVHGQGYLMP